MKNTLEGLALALCQMLVVPGQPRRNADYIINEILEAERRRIDIIIFPEMCVSGYLIGDLYEDEDFCNDVLHQNQRIVEATKMLDITVIFGSLSTDAVLGEDGRMILFNTAFTVHNGEVIARRIKFLQPNYRIFDDDRHLYSGRKLAQTKQKSITEHNGNGFAHSFEPVLVHTRVGGLRIGTMICEDMWHEDYPFNPAQELVNNGAELLVNISASPWTWQKNAKRHRVVKDIIKVSKVPLIYVNHTGIQNNGKNIIIFDGSSTAYNRQGQIAQSIAPYFEGTKDIIWNEAYTQIGFEQRNDTKELYNALIYAIRKFWSFLPKDKKNVFIGLSGGIDSALSIALFSQAIGAEYITAINMPSRYNSDETKSLAEEISRNLGVAYEVISIEDIVSAIAKTCAVSEESFAYQNIQARARMEILAARAQEKGGVFVANGNKVEMAFGYATLYGDMAGFFAPLGDLVKREIYQLAVYINEEVYHYKVIPNACLMLKPTAELKYDQTDPFDYGDYKGNKGYHDEMVRAFTEFRKNPEWFLRNMLHGTLEQSLHIDENRLVNLFGTAEAMIEDLEAKWNMFYASYVKRIQAVPIPIVSKRSFGFDLRESMLEAYFSDEYLKLKERLLGKASRHQHGKIAVFGGSFNPPTADHRAIAEKLLSRFDRVLIVPCGSRNDKDTLVIDAAHRKAMIQACFSELDKVEIDFFDLENTAYMATHILDKRYSLQYPNDEIWHVFGTDIVSDIKKHWQKGPQTWNSLNFIFVPRTGFSLDMFDMPPHYKLLEISGLMHSSTMVRENLRKYKKSSGLTDEVRAYIESYQIYFG